MSTHEIDLRPGTIEYADTGGEGPVIVLLHGLMMGASLWDEVIAELPAGHRYVAPTLPLGAHRHPMNPDADLSLPGIAQLVTEFLDRLGLAEVTLVGNDTGGALTQLLIASGAPRVGRVVLVSCEAFGNLPPGLTGKILALAGKLPPVVRAGHAADAGQATAPAPGRVRVAHQARRRRHRPVAAAGPHPVRDTQGHRAHAARRLRRRAPPAPSR